MGPIETRNPSLPYAQFFWCQTNSRNTVQRFGQLADDTIDVASGYFYLTMVLLWLLVIL